MNKIEAIETLNIRNLAVKEERNASRKKAADKQYRMQRIFFYTVLTEEL